MTCELVLAVSLADAFGWLPRAASAGAGAAAGARGAETSKSIRSRCWWRTERRRGAHRRAVHAVADLRGARDRGRRRSCRTSRSSTRRSCSCRRSRCSAARTAPTCATRGAPLLPVRLPAAADRRGRVRQGRRRCRTRRSPTASRARSPARTRAAGPRSDLPPAAARRSACCRWCRPTRRDIRDASGAHVRRRRIARASAPTCCGSSAACCSALGRGRCCARGAGRACCAPAPRPKAAVDAWCSATRHPAARRSRELADVQRARRPRRLDAELAGRALAALRIAGAYAVGRAVGADAGRGRRRAVDGQLAGRQGLLRPAARAVSSSVTPADRRERRRREQRRRSGCSTALDERAHARRDSAATRSTDEQRSTSALERRAELALRPALAHALVMERLRGSPAESLRPGKAA